MKKLFVFLFLIPAICILNAQSGWHDSPENYQRMRVLLNPYRPAPGLQNPEVRYADLDGDGDPDVLSTTTGNGFPVKWIDDDDDMVEGDTEGDTDNDCLMIDINKDGVYDGPSDMVVDWVDSNDDGKADMQVVIVNAAEGKTDGLYMWVIDTDKDEIFNYVDWNTMTLRCWIHYGLSDFFEDYHGNSLFMKVHRNVGTLPDPSLNWENPFLFYDPDNDGLSEMAFRLIDTKYSGNYRSNFNGFSGNIIWTSMSFDLDNDNAPGNEFDMDMTINFSGPGFNYMDQVHKFDNMRGLPDADSLFTDPRIRQLGELIYPDHKNAWDLIHNRGKWDRVYFTFDEDDDCSRWERVELYHPGSVFKVGGIDPGQSDAAGDRGEWDLDNSGKGNLYVSRFDGRIHLFGAEWGAWRVDQNAFSFQGMGGLYDGYGPGRSQTIPEKFATLKYSDTNNNGFLDKIEYDMDGDTVFEHTVSLLNLGIDDRCEIIETKGMKYKDLARLNSKVSRDMWKNALGAIAAAELNGINIKWYTLMLDPKSLYQKYSYGYWLQLYIYHDLIEQGIRNSDKKFLNSLDKAYYTGDWKGLYKLNKK